MRLAEGTKDGALVTVHSNVMPLLEGGTSA